LQGLRPAQLKLIFASSSSFSGKQPQATTGMSQPTAKVLAYVEWFTKPGNEPHPTMQMFQVNCDRNPDGSRRGDVIEPESIVQPCPLAPCFKALAKDIGDSGSEVNGDNCLDLVDKFWINSFHDQATYQSVF
jgi:hypothetical protein